MSDLVERLRWLADNIHPVAVGEAGLETIREAANALEQRWIRVSERLPVRQDTVTWYLVAGKNTDSGYRWIGLCEFIGDEDAPKWKDEQTDAYGDYLEWTYEVTHWMPLPPPPSE